MPSRQYPHRVYYRAVYRLAARPFALSNVQAGVGRVQFATIHHAAASTKNVLLHHVWVGVESASAATILMADLARISTAPATGNPAIVPTPANPGDAAAEATCLALPTTPGTEGALYSSTEFNLGITGAASVANPPPDLAWRDLVALTSDARFPGDSGLEPVIRVGVLEGWAVIIDNGAASTQKAYVIIEFSEEN